MEPSLKALSESIRIGILADSILWGNAHFQLKIGLSIASNGNAYTIKNLQYAASLLEAVAENRNVEISKSEAVTRANTILKKILQPHLPENLKTQGKVPRYYGAQNLYLSDRIVADSVLSILVFLDIQRESLNITEEAANQIREALGPILRLQIESKKSEDQNHGKKQFKLTSPTFPVAGKSDLQVISQFEKSVGRQYHWSMSLPPSIISEGIDISILTAWPFPFKECQKLDDCKDNSCYVRGYDRDTWTRTGAYIPARFFKGDYKNPSGRTIPVVFVGGWQIQLLSVPNISDIGHILESLVGVVQNPLNILGNVLNIFNTLSDEITEMFSASEPSGLAFTEETSFSTFPPRLTPPQGRKAIHPPIQLLFPIVSFPQEFYGLATMLKCAAGYDHVRFSLSHPMDDIQIAADELYAVVDDTKKLYQVDKVIIVCHSRGGLVARRYILDRWKRENKIDVKKLITYGSAHLGAELAEVAEEIITTPILHLITPSFFNPLLDTIGLVPGIGQQIKNWVQEAIIRFIGELAEPFWDELAVFLQSGEQLKPTSNFITTLNMEYNEPLISLEGRPVSFWQAIDHVLIAGTTPTWFTHYLGSYIPNISGGGIWLSAAEQLIPKIGWTTVRIGPFRVRVPYPYWEWNWTWHPIYKIPTDLIPSAEAPLVGLACLAEGQGDTFVEKTSALAEGISGNIRRAEFAVQHFALRTNHEQYTVYDSPSGRAKVNPWQLLFHELEIPDFSQRTKCLLADTKCEEFDISKAG